MSWSDAVKDKILSLDHTSRVKMSRTNLWLSYKQEKYAARLENAKRVLRWTGAKKTWDCDNCIFSIIPIKDDLIHIVARRAKSFDSSYVERQVHVNLMMGFTITAFEKPVEEEYSEPVSDDDDDKGGGKKGTRWAIHLKHADECSNPTERPISNWCIWQWAETDSAKTIEQSEVFKIYDELARKQHAASEPEYIFNVTTEKQDKIIPVFYQPRIDAWKNFVREIHTHRIDDNEIEVTIIFNDEQLRRHSILDSIYRIFRLFRYNRIKDIESFRIKLDKTPTEYTFESIYSGKYTLYDDSIHEDKPDEDGIVPLHKIKYYFSSVLHPIVFVNTSNHALAEHDNNHFHWKWEYLAWVQNSSVVYGTKSRDIIDNEFRQVKTK
jgi:hypothetical protein